MVFPKNFFCRILLLYRFSPCYTIGETHYILGVRVVENRFAKKMLQIVNEDLEAVQYEMKELDRQYIDKQKRARQLKKAKMELELLWDQGDSNTNVIL